MAIVNVTSGKITGVGPFSLAAASLCIPITYVIGDVLTEVYGYTYSRRATWALIASSVILAIFCQFAAWLPPAKGFIHNDAFSIVLGQMPRIVLAAWVALLAGQFTNDFVLAKMKIATRGRYLWARTIGSTAAGQAVDTTVFYSAAFVGVLPGGLLTRSIISAWLIKVSIEVLITPMTYLVVNRLKRVENVDHFDNRTNFTPFSMSIDNR